MSRSLARPRIGISGWRYAPWRKVFYPSKLPQREELSYASRQLNSIEINGSFYSLQSPESYKRWYRETPSDFAFSLKGPRFISHIKRLRDCQAPLGNFFASGVLHLQEKFGPILWQLPPSFLYRPEVFDEFFSLLPRDFKQAARLSQKADRLDADLPIGAKTSKRKIRHCLEVRHHSFENPEFIEQLRKHNVTLVFADTAGKWPYIEDLTGDFVYIRLHGEKAIYRSGYDDHSLRFWRDRIHLWQSGREPKNALTISTVSPRKIKRDVFIYFDNDMKVRAPFDAMRLAKMLRKPRRA